MYKVEEILRDNLFALSVDADVRSCLEEASFNRVEVAQMLVNLRDMVVFGEEGNDYRDRMAAATRATMALFTFGDGPLQRVFDFCRDAERSNASNDAPASSENGKAPDCAVLERVVRSIGDAGLVLDMIKAAAAPELEAGTLEKVRYLADELSSHLKTAETLSFGLVKDIQERQESAPDEAMEALAA